MNSGQKKDFSILNIALRSKHGGGPDRTALNLQKLQDYGSMVERRGWNIAAAWLPGSVLRKCGFVVNKY